MSIVQSHKIRLVFPARRIGLRAVLYGSIALTNVTGAHAQSATPSLNRLLQRLDRAPVSWPVLERAAQRGDDVARASTLVSSVTAPLSPKLERLTKNRAWQWAGRLPLVGGMASNAQNALQLGLSLNSGFTVIVQEDRKQLAPLRRAALSGARLQRTRTPGNVPAVASSFTEAAQVLAQDENQLAAQRRKIVALQRGLSVLAPALNRQLPASRRAAAARLAQQRLSDAIALLDRRTAQLTAARHWLEDGASEARQVSP